jgi:hypothetical protein
MTYSGKVPCEVLLPGRRGTGAGKTTLAPQFVARGFDPDFQSINENLGRYLPCATRFSHLQLGETISSHGRLLSWLIHFI